MLLRQAVGVAKAIDAFSGVLVANHVERRAVLVRCAEKHLHAFMFCIALEAVGAVGVIDTDNALARLGVAHQVAVAVLG